MSTHPMDWTCPRRHRATREERRVAEPIAAVRASSCGWTNPQDAADEQGTEEDEHVRARPGNGIECCAVRIAPHQASVVHEA